MKIQDEIKKIKTDTQSLRNFGFVVGGIFFAIGLFTGWKSHAWLNFFVCLGVTLIALGAVGPRLLKFIFIGWMTLGLLLGLIVAPIMFTLLYALTFIPIRLIASLMGKNFLDFEFSKGKSSYWINKNAKADICQSADNQF